MMFTSVDALQETKDNIYFSNMVDYLYQNYYQGQGQQWHSNANGFHEWATESGIKAPHCQDTNTSKHNIIGEDKHKLWSDRFH